MTLDPGQARQPPGVLDNADHSVMARPSWLANWGWFIAKNLIGWVLIVSAFPLGALIPGPGGIPLFLIGFGLITFPGKRRLVAALLRGKPIRSEEHTSELQSRLH